MGFFTRPVEPAKTREYSAHRSLTGAAVRLNLTDKNQADQLSRRRGNNQWQDDAWEYYDLVGEVKYGFNLYANVLSRIRLVPAIIEDEDEPPVHIKDSELDDETKRTIRKVMRRVFSSTNQSQILRKAAINFLVAGECYLVQMPPKFGTRDKEQWKIVSINELINRNGKYFIKTGQTHQQNDWEELPTTSFVGRIWQEHPRYSDDADSSMKALVELCDDLFLYTRAARSAARSRLNAGLLFVPDEMSVSVDQVNDLPDDLNMNADAASFADDPEEDLFEQEIIDHFTTPTAGEGSAAEVVPFIVRGPAEMGDKLKHIKFDRPFDPQIAQRAERALERILQGIDLPKDIVTGLANIKYSNAVQIEESLYTSHIEPRVLMLCDAFRAVYMEPALLTAGLDPDLIDRLIIWYDPRDIMTAPDKSSAANSVYDKFAISGAALRRYNGFTEADAPDAEELAQRLAIARGSLDEATTTAIFRTLFPEILDAARAAAMAANPTGAYSPGVQQALGGTPGAQPPPEPGGTAAPAPGGLPPIIDAGSGGAQPPPPVPGS